MRGTIIILSFYVRTFTLYLRTYYEEYWYLRSENYITYTSRWGRNIPLLDTVNGHFYHYQIFN